MAHKLITYNFKKAKKWGKYKLYKDHSYIYFTKLENNFIQSYVKQTKQTTKTRT